MAWTPANISTTLWLDASDSSTITLDGSGVEQWADKSGNDNHAGQANTANQPTMTTEYSLGALSLNGSGHFMSLGTPIDITTDMSVFLVFVRGSSGIKSIPFSTAITNGNPHTLLWWGDNLRSLSLGGGSDTFGSASTATGAFVMSAVRTATDLDLWQTGNHVGNDTSQTVSGSLSYIGRWGAGTNYHNGKICEIIVVSGVFSATDRERMEGYLAHKWGAEDDLPAEHPHKDTPPGYTLPVIAATELQYYLGLAPAVAAHNLDYIIFDSNLTSAVDLDWSYYIQGVATITLPESTDVIAATTIAWRNAWEITRGVTIAWDGYADVIGAVELGWAGVDEVIGASSMVWNLESQTPVIAPVDLLWSATPDAAQLPLSISFTYDDQAAYLGADITGTGSITSPSGLPGISGSTGSGAAAGVTGGTVSAGLASITSATLRFDRREYANRATLTLADHAEYLACPVGTAIEFAVGGSTVRYRVVDRARERSDLADGGWRYTLHLSSPAAWLDKPYARPVTDDPAGMAATIAASLATPLTLDWQTVDWTIAADLLPAAGRTPLDLLRTVAGTVGAVVVSETDGSLTIEPEYPVSVPGWATATPDYYIDEAETVFSANEDEDQRDRVNAVTISNQIGEDNAGTISIEVTTDDTDELLRELRVYTVPWNPDATMRHTDAARVQLNLVGIESRLETELVEIVDGLGRTRYPIASVGTTEYMTVDLGEIEWTEAGEITTTTAAESLIEITYTTRCRMWTLSSPHADPVQVVAEAADQTGGTSGITVLVTRGSGDRRGDDVFDQLITTIPAAMERGRNIIDAASSNRAMVQLLTPASGLFRPGSLVEVRDMEIPAWRGLLQSQEIRLEVGDTLVAESILEIEREVI